MALGGALNSINLGISGAFLTGGRPAQGNNSGLPTYAELRSAQKQQQRLAQNVFTVGALTGLQVSPDMLAEANARLNSVVTPRGFAGQGGGNLTLQSGLVQQDLAIAAQTGTLDPTTLLTGLMRLDQIAEAKEQAAKSFKEFAKGTVKALESPAAKSKPVSFDLGINESAE
jgi:hypothetical protein